MRKRKKELNYAATQKKERNNAETQTVEGESAGAL